MADISWRTTRVRLLGNNMVIIPNAKLSQSVMTNFYLPEKRMSLLIPVGVSYNCDPARVEAVLLEVAKGAAGELPGLLADPAPFVRFIPGFGDSRLISPSSARWWSSPTSIPSSTNCASASSPASGRRGSRIPSPSVWSI